MQGLKAELLRGLWYLAVPASAVRPGETVAKTLLGEPVLIGRASDGAVFAVRDICPHRGMPLRFGRFDGDTLTCSYHGWRFDRTGTCVDVPSLREGQEVALDRIRCGAYPCAERYGLIWVYMPPADAGAAAGASPQSAPPVPPPPDVPLFQPSDAPKLHIVLPFDCSTDHAAFGLMDPAHAAYVHTSWWFKKEATRLRPKEKQFEPSELGWRMVRHPLPPQNTVYKVFFGANATTEISYRLPGLRFEEIRGARHAAVGLTALTPITEETTEVHQMFWATHGWSRPVAPLLRRLMRSFLDQDRRVAAQQREGLVHHPRLMLVNDANTQARWWMHIKDEWQAAQREGRAFVNPLEPKTLRWRS